MNIVAACGGMQTTGSNDEPGSTTTTMFNENTVSGMRFKMSGQIR